MKNILVCAALAFGLFGLVGCQKPAPVSAKHCHCCKDCKCHGDCHCGAKQCVKDCTCK
jgi:hypothetical protein